VLKRVLKDSGNHEVNLCWSSCRMHLTSISLHMWFRLLARKEKQYMQAENVIFILLICPKYLNMPFVNWWKITDVCWLKLF